MSNWTRANGCELATETRWRVGQQHAVNISRCYSGRGIRAVIGMPVFARAAGRGDLDMLPWAKANGCEWDAETMSCGEAIGGAHLAMPSGASMGRFSLGPRERLRVG